MAIQFQVIDGLANDQFGFQLLDTQIGQVVSGPFVIGNQQAAENLLNAVRSNTTTAYFDQLAANAGADQQAVNTIRALEQNTAQSWQGATQLGYDLNGAVGIEYEGNGQTALATITEAAEGDAIELAGDVLEIIALL